MELDEKIVELKIVSTSITYYKNLKKIGYFLIVFLIGIFIVIFCQKEIRRLETQRADLVKKIEYDIEESYQQVSNIYQKIIESKTYLIYSQKSSFIQKCESLLREIGSLTSDTELFSKKTQKFLEQSQESILFYNSQINDYNEQFIQKRLIEYQDLFEKSPFPLDENQRRAVIVDDKHNLVIAGAGSGKTETLITRIAYLILRYPDTIRPERILALAYQKKAAQEIKDRLKERFGLDVTIKTFHSLGLEILQKEFDKPPQLLFSGDNFEIQYQEHITKIFDKVKGTLDFQINLLRYITFFGDNFLIEEESNFQKKEEYFRYIENLSYTALNGTKVKSEAERNILNFLLMHTINGKHISVKYESPATWATYFDRAGKERSIYPDFFLPDFNIYIEHWAIDRKGNVPDWFFGTNPSKKYKESINAKREQFSKNKQFSLLETFHWEYQHPAFSDIFRDRLQKTLEEKNPDKTFTIRTLSYDEIVAKSWRDCKESVSDLSNNCAKFIQIAKTYHLTPADIKTRLTNERWTGRQRAFSSIALHLYERYETDLRSKNRIDFQDMINLAIDKLLGHDTSFQNVFDHILIDEYQDISTQRSDLIKALMQKNKNCKLFCVGDDWQSITGFTGSNLDFFVNFDKYFDHPARTDLTINYRSCKSIVDLGAAIIQQNGDAQIKKVTLAKNPAHRKIIVYASTIPTYDWNKYYQKMIEHCVDRVEQYLFQGYQPQEILILARILKKNMIREKLLNYAKVKGIPISIEYRNPQRTHLMTIHKSKGLQAKVVIILDVVKGLYGFPCEIENPDIYEPVIIGPGRKREEEERRIFYVAATRAKEDLIIYTQKDATSEFLREVKENLVIEEF